MEALVHSLAELEKISEDGLTEALNRLSREQKINALAFGELSDYHIALLRDILEREKSFRTKAKAVLKRECIRDMIPSYTGKKPFGSSRISQKEYNDWRATVTKTSWWKGENPG